MATCVSQSSTWTAHSVIHGLLRVRTLRLVVYSTCKGAKRMWRPTPQQVSMRHTRVSSIKGP